MLLSVISLLIHRSNLEAAEAALAATESSLKEKETELKQARLSLTDTTIRLNESERNINHLQENRWSTYKERSQQYSHVRKSLLQELKAAKEVLISSLKNVHDLELESRKVPKLEAQIHHLENKIARRRSQFYSISKMLFPGILGGTTRILCSLTANPNKNRSL